MSRRGHRRLGVLGLGLLAAISMVWQQNATVASYADSEFGKATFTTADKLPAITPTLTTSAATATATWTPTTRNWATPAYALNAATSDTGANATSLYSGPGVLNGLGQFTATDSDGWGSRTTRKLDFTAVAAGTTHACGIALGTVYCWGTSLWGGLGLDSTTTVPVPTAVVGQLKDLTATAITAGTDFTCALAGGNAYCWGKGELGQLGTGGQSSKYTPQLVSSLAGVNSISAGTAHACALVGATNKPYCWGEGSSGQLGDGGAGKKESPDAVKVDGVLSGRTMSSISAGGAHTCSVADGQAYCWGANASGQLGDGTANPQTTPVGVDAANQLAGRTVSTISTGSAHTCAIADSKAFCWGEGGSSQLGNGGNTDSARPVAVSGSSAFTAISAGAMGTCGLNAGAVRCWGFGAWGTPAAISGPSGRSVTGLSIGSDFGCAIAENAPAACAGNASSYQLGNNSNSGYTTTFADVSLSGPACPDKSVRTSSTACSLLEGTDYFYRLGYKVGSWMATDSAWTKATTKVRSGAVISAGDTTKTSTGVAWTAAQEPGQAYAEYTVKRSLVSDGSNPSTVAITGARSWTDRGGLPASRTFSAVVTGEAHTCGTVGDDLYCWGQNQYGQLGIGNTDRKSVPTKVDFDDKKVTAVSAGQYYTCAIASDKVYCWGSDGTGQLGNGAGNNSLTPSAVSGLTGTSTAISAGTGHACAISDGAAYCWGRSSDGQLGIDSTNNSQTAVAVKTTGAMGSQKVTKIAAGGVHSCAIGADNRAYCWGSNSSGQLGNNTSLKSWLSVEVTWSGVLKDTTADQISAGEGHTCVIASKRVYCWGKNSDGQLGNNALNTNSPIPVTVSTGAMNADVTLVSAGAKITCAATGTKAYCWGANGSGQLGNGSTTSSAVPIALTAAGALSSATVTSLAVGATHACLAANSSAFCWGDAGDGRLGNRTISGTSTVPVLAVADARCASGATALGNGTCSLAPATSYWYRVTYTLDGNTSTRSDWTKLNTASP